MAYTHEQMLEKMQAASQDMNTFYQQAFVNYQGFEKGSELSPGKGAKKSKGLAYSEDIAEFLLSNPDVLDGISVPAGVTGYRTESHNGVTDNPDSNRAEERIALGMFGNTYEHIGYVFDYQTPLTNLRTDRHVGKIDLLSRTDDEIWLLELKKFDSEETLLCCILEAYTCLRRVDAAKLKSDFELDASKPLQAGILVFRDQDQHESYKKPDTAVRRLMTALDVHIFVLAKENKEYLVGMAD